MANGIADHADSPGGDDFWPLSRPGDLNKDVSFWATAAVLDVGIVSRVYGLGPAIVGLGDVTIFGMASYGELG